MSDDELLAAMFDRDPAIAKIAVRIYKSKHEQDAPLPTPAHCSECFEGCDKCQPKTR